MQNNRDNTLCWKFRKQQFTGRFYTQPVLAIYDRFDLLMHGSEMLIKDLLEYMVFEKYVSNEYCCLAIA